MGFFCHSPFVYCPFAGFFLVWARLGRRHPQFHNYPFPVHSCCVHCGYREVKAGVSVVTVIAILAVLAVLAVVAVVAFIAVMTVVAVVAIIAALNTVWASLSRFPRADFIMR